MKERGAVVAGHADDNPRVERDDTGARPIGWFEICHSRIKIPESARIAYRGYRIPEFRLASLSYTGSVRINTKSIIFAGKVLSLMGAI